MLQAGKDPQSWREGSTKVDAGLVVRRVAVFFKFDQKLTYIPFLLVQTETADSFPFVGPVPHREGHFIAAGFAGHGK